MRLYLHKYHIIIVLWIFISSCGLVYEDVKIQSVSNVQIKNLSSRGMNIIMEADIYNPNNYDITIVETDMDVYLNNNKYGKAIVKENVKLPKKSTTTHTFKIDASYENLASGGLNGMLNLFMSKNQKLKLDGKVKARVFFITKSFPFTLEQNVTVNQ
jgi:LEA14-like dessication related protein